jgi:hypothetical protein
VDQKLVVILAVDEDSELAFERNDRCSAWASSQGWRLRRRLIIDGEQAKDKATIRQQIIQIAESMAADILLTDSLSQISTDGLVLTELIELLESKSMQLVALKECLHGATAQTRLTAMLGAVSPYEDLKLVFAGPKDKQGAATKAADALGWELLIPRAKRFEQQLESAPDRVLLLPSLDALGDSAFMRAAALDELLKTRERIFILDAGLDSAAPSFHLCARAQIACGGGQATYPTQALQPAKEDRPEPLELLKQWIGRRRKTIRGSAVKYMSQSGYSNSVFYRIIHEATDKLIREIDALTRRHGNTERTSRELGIVGNKYGMSIEELQFAISWSENADRRSRSSSGATTSQS